MRKGNRSYAEQELPSETFSIEYREGAPMLPTDMIGDNIIISRERIADAFAHMGALITTSWVSPMNGDNGEEWEATYTIIYRLLGGIMFRDMFRDFKQLTKRVQTFLRMTCETEGNRNQPTILESIKKEAS